MLSRFPYIVPARWETIEVLYYLKMEFLQEREECPICYKLIGEQDDGSFLTKNGKANSQYAEVCNHYVCNQCCWQLSTQATVQCPMCRESWTEWIHATYYHLIESDDESESLNG